MTNQIEKLATSCAKEAIEAGGSSPFDSDGECLLPTEPLPGDWDHLEGELARDATEEEEEVFAGVFGGVMSDHIKELK